MGDFYTKSAAPTTGSSLSSSVIRAEFALIEAGFDKLPALSGNGSKFLRINSGATAVEALSASELGLVTRLDSDTSTATVSDTTTETTVYSFSVPANTLSTNRALRINLIADWINNSGSSETCTLRVKLGSTTVATFAETFTSNSVRRPYILRSLISANGATNAQVANSEIHFGSVPASLDGTLSASNTVKNSMHTSIAEDATSSKTLSITVQHSVANASIDFRALAVCVELV